MAFIRDRLTWTGYLLCGWFAYLQAVPGLAVPHLRTEMVMSYAVAGMHVSALAGGSIIASLLVGAIECRLGRRRLIWGSALLMALGALGLTLGRIPTLTIACVLVMGLGGGLLLSTIQAMLTDHHGAFRTLALTEANVAASFSYVVLIGVFTLLAALHLNWRVAIFAALLVPLASYIVNRRMAVTPPAPVDTTVGASTRLPRAFWVAVVMIFCTVAAEWCLTGWGASFVESALDVAPERAVTIMIGYFGGVLAGRVAGSWLARRVPETRLLAISLVMAAVGFGLLLPAHSLSVVLMGLFVAGCGIGNLFPLGFSVAMGFVPGRATTASARVVMVTSVSVLAAPLTIGALADATSITTAMVLVIPAILAIAGALLFAVRRLRFAYE